MNIDEFFMRENHKLIFEKENHKGEFIAEANSEFSNFMKRNEFSHDWAYSNFNGGRYVITIYQRHSVYESGQQVWLNDHFDNSVGVDSRYKFPCYVIILDHPLEYIIKSWRVPLITYTVHNEKDPLQAKTYNLYDAEAEAKKLSKDGHKAVIMEWFEDYNMY